MEQKGNNMKNKSVVIIAIFTFLFGVITLQAAEFSWEDPNQNIDGVRVYMTKVKGEYSQDPNDCLCEVTQGIERCQVTIPPGLFYFTAKSFTAYSESEPSNEISNQPKKPKKFKCLF
jgi:hypothetical protein